MNLSHKFEPSHFYNTKHEAPFTKNSLDKKTTSHKNKRQSQRKHTTMTTTDFFRRALCMCAPTTYSHYAQDVVEDTKYDASYYRSHDTTFMDDYDDDASLCSESNMVMGHIVKKPTFHHSCSSSSSTKQIDSTPVSSVSESKMRMITPAAPIPSWSYLDYYYDEDRMDEDEDDDDVALNSLLTVPQLAPLRLTPPEPSRHHLHQPHGLRRVSSIATASTASLTCVESTDIDLDTDDERDDNEPSRTNNNKQLEGADFDISSSLCTEIVENYGLTSSTKSPISFVSSTPIKQVPSSGKGVFRDEEQQLRKQISVGQEETKEEPEDDDEGDIESYCVLVRMTHENYVH